MTKATTQATITKPKKPSIILNVMAQCRFRRSTLEPRTGDVGVARLGPKARIGYANE